MKTTKHILLVLKFIPLSALALFVWWVIWFMLMGSLMSLEELRDTIGLALTGAEGYSTWPIIPTWPTLQPLVALLLDTPQFFVMFWNTFRLVIPSVLGQLLFGAPAAWALSRFRFRGRKILATVYISLMLLPFQVTMVPNFLVIDSLGLMNNIFAVILPFAFSAFPVFCCEMQIGIQQMQQKVNLQKIEINFCVLSEYRVVLCSSIIRPMSSL